jgi:branched-chain amino acid aminotransferase
MPAESSIFASIDGRIHPAAEAKVSVLDNGFAFGDSVYETLRTYGGRPLLLGRHLERLRASARRLAIEIPVDDGELRARLGALLAHSRLEDAYIRLIVSRGVGEISYDFARVHGPTIVMVVKPFAAYEPAHYAQGVDLALVSVRRNPPEALDPAIKSCNLLNNILAIREAQARGAFEAVLLNGRGHVAECAASNLFIVRGGRAVTPPLSDGILPGITRAAVLEVAREIGVEAGEESFAPPDLLAADEAFITSSLKEVTPVRAIDGRPIGTVRPGPVTQRLLEAFRAALPRLCD